MFKILIVEDDKELSLLFQKVLEKSGYQVKSASDGAQALEVLDREYIDLIISDIMMPVMDGYELVSDRNLSNSMEKICMCGVQPVRQEMNRILLSWHYPNIFRFPTFILRQPIWTSRFFRKRRLVCTMKRALQMCRRNLNASILNRSENHFRFRMKSSAA